MNQDFDQQQYNDKLAQVANLAVTLPYMPRMAQAITV
jgi:hypothetical protein